MNSRSDLQDQNKDKGFLTAEFLSLLIDGKHRSIRKLATQQAEMPEWERD